MVASIFILFVLVFHCFLDRSKNYEWCLKNKYVADVTTPTFHVECGGGCDNFYFVLFGISLLSRSVKKLQMVSKEYICFGCNHPNIPRGIWGWLRQFLFCFVLYSVAFSVEYIGMVSNE